MTPFIEYSEHPLSSFECSRVSTQSAPVQGLRVQHVRGDGRAPLLLRYRRRFFQRLATSSQRQLMAMLTAAPIDLSFQDIRWRGKAVCFERLLALQPFDPAAAAAAGLRRGSHRIDAFLAPLIGELRRHLIDRAGAKRAQHGGGASGMYGEHTIVLSERDSSRRHLTNQAELRTWFTARALKVVNFGKMGLQQAIAFVVTNDVRVIVGNWGTDVNVNPLFMRANSVVVVVGPYIPNSVWCVHARACISVCMRTNLRARAHTQGKTNTRARTHTHTHTHTHKTHINTHTHPRTHKHTQILAQTHTLAHARARTCAGWLRLRRRRR